MAIWIIIARIVVIICFGGLGFVGGAFLWVMFSGQFLLTWPGDLFLWSGISAAVGFLIGGFIGYLISRPKVRTRIKWKEGVGEADV